MRTRIAETAVPNGNKSWYAVSHTLRHDLICPATIVAEHQLRSGGTGGPPSAVKIQGYVVGRTPHGRIAIAAARRSPKSVTSARRSLSDAHEISMAGLISEVTGTAARSVDRPLAAYYALAQRLPSSARLGQGTRSTSAINAVHPDDGGPQTQIERQAHRSTM